MSYFVESESFLSELRVEESMWVAGTGGGSRMGFQDGGGIAPTD